MTTPAALVLSLVLAIGLWDLVARRVPNVLLLVAMALQVALLLFPSAESVGLADTWPAAMLGFALGLICFFPVWRLGVMGAGDVKFLAVLGFSLGAWGLFSSWIIGSLIGAAHAVARIAARKRAGTTGHVQCERSDGAPYATYLAIGAITWVAILSRQ